MSPSSKGFYNSIHMPSMFLPAPVTDGFFPLVWICIISRPILVDSFQCLCLTKSIQLMTPCKCMILYRKRYGI